MENRLYLYKVAENLVYAYFRLIAKNKRLIDRLILSAGEFDSNAEDIIINVYFFNGIVITAQ